VCVLKNVFFAIECRGVVRFEFNPISKLDDKLSYPVVGNLSRVAGQKQTLNGMAGRTDFPPTIPFLLLLLNLGIILN